MDAEELEICEFLKSRRGEFVAAREIARRAGGKARYREDPYWAKPVLARLVVKGSLENDASGHFRLASKQKKKKAKWMSPQIKKILEQSGKTFEIGAEETEETKGSGQPDAGSTAP